MLAEISNRAHRPPRLPKKTPQVNAELSTLYPSRVLPRAMDEDATTQSYNLYVPLGALAPRPASYRLNQTPSEARLYSADLRWETTVTRREVDNINGFNTLFIGTVVDFVMRYAFGYGTYLRLCSSRFYAGTLRMTLWLRTMIQGVLSSLTPLPGASGRTRKARTSSLAPAQARTTCAHLASSQFPSR